MKKISRVGILLFLFSAAASVCYAQEPLKKPFAETVDPSLPGWVSEKGYWQVETNIHHRRHSIVYFYNNDHILVYKETIDGVKLNLSRERTKMELKALLEKAIDAWSNRQPLNPRNQTLAIVFGKRKNNR